MQTRIERKRMAVFSDRRSPLNTASSFAGADIVCGLRGQKHARSRRIQACTGRRCYAVKGIRTLCQTKKTPGLLRSPRRRVTSIQRSRLRATAQMMHTTVAAIAGHFNCVLNGQTFTSIFVVSPWRNDTVVGQVFGSGLPIRVEHRCTCESALRGLQTGLFIHLAALLLP